MNHLVKKHEQKSLLEVLKNIAHVTTQKTEVREGFSQEEVSKMQDENYKERKMLVVSIIKKRIIKTIVFLCQSIICKINIQNDIT